MDTFFTFTLLCWMIFCFYFKGREFFECVICILDYSMSFFIFLFIFSHLLLKMFPCLGSFADRENATVGPLLKTGFNRVRNGSGCFFG